MPAPGQTQRAASKFIVFENFEKLNTQELRTALKESELAWVENLQPLANNNWATVPGPGSPSFNIAGETFSAFFFGVLNGTNYLVAVNTLGGAWAFSTSGQTKFAPNGTFSQVPNQHVDMTSWEQDRFLFNDPVAGYSTWDGTTFAAVGGISPNIPLIAPGFGGSNYTSVPNVQITGGSGSGATAVATVGPPGVIDLSFSSFGAGYATQPGVHFSGGGGSGAAATVTVDPQAVTSLFNNGFLNLAPNQAGVYLPQAGTNPPFFIDAFVSPPGGGGVTATVGTSVGVNAAGQLFVQRVFLTGPNFGGSGYSSIPTIAFAPRTAMVVLQPAVCIVNGIGPGAINGYTVTAGGSYSGTPTVSIDPPTNPAPGGGGVTAAATAVKGGGSVTQITLTNAGHGYQPGDNPPGGTLAITIDPPSGGGTTATAAIRVLPQLPKGTSVAVFPSVGGRVWLNFYNQATGQLNGLQWSGTRGFDDFDTGNASGSLIMPDADLVHQITGVRSYNNFLWIVGDQSIKQIGNISLNSSSNVTLFTILTLSSDQGTTYLKSCISFNRVFFFVNQNGVYAVFGSSVQKISGDLDGVFQNCDFSLLPQASLVDMGNVHCVMWLVRYNDPASSSRSLFLIFDGKRWFPGSQGNNIKTVVGSCTLASPNWVPYASSGGDVTPIFNSLTTPVAFQAVTALTHHGNPVQRKKTVRQGWAMQLKSGGPASLLGSMQSDENAGAIFSIPLRNGFQTRSVADPNVSGTYLGMTISGTLAGFTLANLRIEYQETNVGNQS